MADIKKLITQAEKRIDAIISDDDFRTTRPEAVAAMLESLRLFIDAVPSEGGHVQEAQLNAVGDSIEVEVTGNQVYVWWRTKHNARVTIIARHQDTLMFDIKNGAIREVKD